MTRCFCIAQTQTQAIRILGILRKAEIEGFDGMIVSTPREFVRTKSCSYSVGFSSAFRQKVYEILKNNNIKNEIVCN